MVARKTLFLTFFLCCTQLALFAQASDGLSHGISLYGEGRWRDAVLELRRVESTSNGNDEGEVLYWISLAEISAGDYEAAINDLDRLAKLSPPSDRSKEVPYHKGRALYYLGRYDEAIILLKTFGDSVPNSPLYPSSLYWVGECLYSLGRFSEARSVFSIILDRFRQSVKYEAASYRIALIDQKGREEELLRLLKWSHEESLKSVEEYQKRERSYEQAITAYQKRIAEMLKDTRLADLEEQVRELDTSIANLEGALTTSKDAEAKDQQRIKELESSLAAAKANEAKTAEDLVAAKAATAAALKKADALAAAAASVTSSIPAGSDAKMAKISRLLAMKAQALELKEALYERLVALEGASK